MGSSSASPMGRLSAALVDWTPPVMLVAYLVFSFFFYCLVSVGTHTTFWYLFLGIQTASALFAAAIAIRSVRPNVLARRLQRKIAKENFTDVTDDKCPPIHLIVPAQLPFKGHDLLCRQVRYLLRELDYPTDKLRISVAFNAVAFGDSTEQELAELESRHWNLHLHRVEDARTTAHMVNHVLSEPHSPGHITAVLSVDQFPETSCLRYVARKFNTGDVDVVQCRAGLYKTGGSMWTRVVAAEMDLFQGVFAPGRASLDGLGACASSTAFYSTSLLKALQMRPSAVNSRQDLSLRATMSGARITYEVSALVVESGPSGFGAWLKQRSNWAQSWAQLNGRYSLRSLKHGAFGSPVRTRIGLFSTLWIRDGYFHLLAQFCCVALSTFVANPPSTWPAAQRNRIGFKVSYWLLVWNLFCICIIGAINYRNRSAFTTRLDVILFFVLSPFYLVLLAFVGLSGQFRQLAGSSTRSRR